ncbi:MAG: hypothetical protein ACPHRO_06990, partial [Nannocystaceae bacterium]
MDLARLGRWLDRVAYHQLTSVDTRWLAAARIFVAGVFLVQLMAWIWVSPALEGAPAFLSDAVGRAFAAR